jgi:guanylate kinase
LQKSIYLFLGPSGSGKTTLGQHLQKYNIPEIVSHTTRKPRVGEINGVHYYFVSEEEFDQIEMLEKIPYSGNYYGTSIAEVTSKLEKYGSAYAVLNIDGIRLFKQKFGDLVKVIYIYCDSDTLYQRMLDRGDSEEQAQKRMDNLIKTGELHYIGEADYVIRTDKHNIDYCKKMVDFIVEN